MTTRTKITISYRILRVTEFCINIIYSKSWQIAEQFRRSEPVPADRCRGRGFYHDDIRDKLPHLECSHVSDCINPSLSSNHR
jgi:hypothetical protein